MATPSFERLHGARAIHMHDEIELLRQPRREIVARPLCLRSIQITPIARSRRGPAQRRQPAPASDSRTEGRHADVMKETLVTPRQGGANGRKAAGSSHSCAAVTSPSCVVMPIEQQADPKRSRTAEIQFTDVGHARGARVTEV